MPVVSPSAALPAPGRPRTGAATATATSTAGVDFVVVVAFPPKENSGAFFSAISPIFGGESFSSMASVAGVGVGAGAGAGNSAPTNPTFVTVAADGKCGVGIGSVAAAADPNENDRGGRP